MENSLELTTSQIKAYGNGATMFMFPMDMKIDFSKGMYISNTKGNYINTLLKEDDSLCSFYIERFINEYVDFTVFAGNKDIFVKEEFYKKDVTPTYPYPIEDDEYEYVQAYKADYNEEDIYLNCMFPKDDEKVKDIKWRPSSQMTKEQSRYTLKEILDVKIVKVQEIKIKEFANIINTKSPVIYSEFIIDAKHHYNTVLKEQNINRTFNDNDYVFLVEIKR